MCGIFETGLIPPNVNFRRPNPSIRWAENRFRVPIQVEQLKFRSHGRPPLVAMTSSGIGGANGHAVVEGPPTASPRIASFWTDCEHVPTLFVVGGLSPKSAVAVGQSLQDSFDEDLRSLARMMGRRARSMTWRSFALVRTNNHVMFNEPVLVPKHSAPIVFVFSGQGTQHFHSQLLVP